MKSLVERPTVSARSVPLASDAAALPPAERRTPEQALLEAVLTHRRTVFLICLGFTRHRWDAEDLAQETYVRAQLNLSRLRDVTSARAWVCRIARNVCRDHLRRMRWRRLFTGSVDDVAAADTPASLVERRERMAVLKRAIERLPQRMREVFVLRAYGDLSYEEIADALELRMGTVMSRLHRARAALARQMEETAP